MIQKSTLAKSVAFAFALSSALPSISFAKDPLPVVATFSILGDMVKQVGGEHIALTTLVGHDGDAHVYQPTPKDASAVSSAKVLFVNGLEFEGWMERLVGASNFQGMQVVATDGITAIPFEEGGDEHDEHEGHDDHKDHDEHEGHDDHKDHDDHAGHDEHGHGAHAFEWAGVFDLSAGTYKWSFAKVDGDYADPAMKMVVLEAGDIEASEELAEKLLESASADAKADGDVLVAQEKAYSLNFDASKEMTIFSVEIKKDGKYTFFTEHMPFEFEANEHFFKDLARADVEPIAQEPDSGHHHHHHGAFDPHAWQSATNAIVYVNNIAAGLSKADPTNASAYEANRAAYVAKLETLDADIKKSISGLAETSRTVVTSHDAFGYFSADYGLNFIAPVGLSTESEASAADVAKLITQIREDNISAVFVESIADNRLIDQIARETGAKVGGTLYSDALGGPDSPASTYLDMMRHNTSTILDAIEQ